MDYIPLINNDKRGREDDHYQHTPKKKRRSRKSFAGDPRLFPRLKQFIESKRYSKGLMVDELLTDLQNTYPEYRRKKQNVLKTAVMKIINIIQKDQPTKAAFKNIDNDSSVQMLKDSSDFSDNDGYVQYEDTNMVNKSLSNLYKKAPNSFPKMEVAEEEEENAENIQQNVSDSSRVHKRKQNASTPASVSKIKKKKKEILLQESTITFADLGGMESALKEVCKLLLHMKHPEVFQKLGVKPPRGVLLHGPPGCGKTLLAHAIAGELELPFIKIAATEVVSGVSGESEEKIRDLFERAVNSAPCVLFIDEIDAITPKRETAQREMERRIVSQLLTCMDELNQKEITMQVLVIGATNRPDSVDAAFRRAGRFDREICLGIPDEAARERILQVLCRDLRLASDFNFKQLASKTPGYVGADLMALMREAAMCAVNRIFRNMEKKNLQEANLRKEKSIPNYENQLLSECSVLTLPGTVDNSISEFQTALSWLRDQLPLTDEELEDLYIEMQDFEGALKVVQPSAKREGFATVPSVTWDDVGALKDVRGELELAILAPVRHKQQFEALGLQTPAGILLCGPPGCGKTLLAKAIANECGINFISVKGPELLNMYVGESERAVRQCFQRAKSSAPCVIFFDELDALCPRRSETADSGASSRVVNQLLTEMDGLESRKQVFILAATNRPDIIDPAVLRPGRLDKVVYVGLPTPEDRRDILKTITKNGTKPKLAEDVDLHEISCDNRCEGFTGADLAALVREAAVMALQEHLQSLSADKTAVPHVEKKHFEKAFSKMKASISLKDQKIYEKMKRRTLIIPDICNKGKSKDISPDAPQS